MDERPVITHPAPTPADLPAGAVCSFGVHIAFPDTELTRYSWYSGGRVIAALETGRMRRRSS